MAEKYNVRLNIAWVFLGVLAATAVGSMMVTLFTESIDGGAHQMSGLHASIDYIETFGFLMLFGIFVSSDAALIIGWPLYMIGKSLRIINPIMMILGGASIPCIVMLICECTGFNIPPISDIRSILALACLAFCGAVGGLVSCIGLYKRDDSV